MALDPDVITIHLRFGMETSLGLYQDTLVFTEDEWAKRDASAVEKAKQALADKWVTFRSAQIAEEEALATKEGQLARLAYLDERIGDLQAEADTLRAATASEVVAAEPAVLTR